MAASLAEQLSNARVYDLEQPRFYGMPIHPAHKPGYFYSLHRRHRDGYQPERHGPRTSASGVLTMMEHSGTHIDALCHQSFGLKLHGDIPVEGSETASGFRNLGIETVPPLLRRGVLLDVAGWKGTASLAPKYGITEEDLSGCAAAERVEVRAGDVLLVRTGYGNLWRDEAVYLQAAGVSKAGTIWAAERGVVAVGADNMAWDVPDERDPDTGSTLFAHAYLLPQKGIYIMENLNLEELARAHCHVFAFIGIPLKFTGATGSPLRPLALV
ncbi:MAG TPA: cyclase family protein [Gemmataceae bacterium]|nr:cyclase family protein [Gemmataceae bacterium]